MNCTECKEKLAELLEGLLPESQRQIVEEHLKDCQACQAELQELKELSERLISDSNAWQQTNLEDAVFNRIINEQNKRLKQADRVNRQFRIWRQIMNSKITRYTAAAVVILIVVLGITFLDKAVTPVYALDQTIRANHSVYSLHIKGFHPEYEEPSEMWVECGPDGKIENIRLSSPKWSDKYDGDKLMVWKENKLQVWLKRKNIFGIIKDTMLSAQVLKMAEEFAPKLAVERLRDRQQQGEIKLEIIEPANKAELIVVTATALEEGDAFFPTPTPSNKADELSAEVGSMQKDKAIYQRIILFVDQATKLVSCIEFYQLKDSDYQKKMTLEFYDYNVPIDSKMFTLDDEVPPDVLRIDQTTQEVGLVQGQLTDEEIAVEVVRQFFEALIASDFVKAGRLLEGLPAEEIKKDYGKVKYLRIVSIEKPTKPQAGAYVPGAFRVPCTIEIEKDGKIEQWKPYGPFVRPVMGQHGRWTICGGI